MFGIWGKREAGDCTHRPRRKTHLMVPALAGMALAATVMTQTAVANPLDDLASLLGFGDAAPAAAADHVVDDTVSPSGTTIDLFDYWLTTENGPENPANLTSAGINSGNQLWFSGGMPEGSGSDFGKTINHYIGQGKGPYFGIVSNSLGDDGYPSLQEGMRYRLGYRDYETRSQSLAYLFNPLVSNTYKKSYPNATGLLQLDADGYYYYDSRQNFASYDKDAGRFVLYDGAAVDGSGFAGSTKGMFFPFNTAEQVFTNESLNGSGPLESTVGPGGLNHYFGLSMTSYFMQPAGGKSNGKDMVFEFSGDDDVWVFIDGKLVGDVGGIHERVGLSINFATGDIRIFNTSTAGGSEYEGWDYKKTSLQEIFGSENLENGTFKAGSYHTLKFYYLERGSGPSNLSLKYNLVDIPASTMTKVDQLGKGVQGAEFKLYQTDAAYENEKLIGSGVTDATGSFTFTDANTVPINFMNLNASGISHYVLKETKTPEGYRKSPDARLKYVTNADKSIGFLLSDNYWESGVYARPEQVVTIAGGTVKEYGNGREIEVGDGNVFAVILKRDRSVDDMNACWHAVSGNSVAGWTVSKNAITSTTQLADVQKVYFEKNEDGKYVADLKELPGDPEQYYSMVSKENQDAGNFDYTVAFYAYDGKSNISRLDTSTQYFQRQSAANLHVTDIKNMLHVQKVDDAGTPVNGVTFNLYRSNQMIEADGKLAPRAGEDPAFTGKTQDNRNNNDATIKMDGMLSLGPLSPGTYYLVEDADKAPKGYIPNDAVVRVIVDDEGVHADAGVEGDGVVTLGGIGSLVDSMSQFGVKDDIDMTLYRVIATKATSTASDADGDGAYALDAWKPGTDTVTMENRPGSAYLEYVPVDSGIKAPGFTVDTGYVRAMVSQAKKPDASDLGLANWTDLSKVANKNLSALFTGTNIVRITNERAASVAVSKEVAVPEGFELSKDAKSRDFTLTFTFGDLGTLPADTAFDAATFAVDENGAEHQVGNDYTIKSGETHTLKHGETIKVYGLPNGASYKVEESPDTLYPQTQPADGGAIAGEVVAGETQTGTFVNTYTPTPATVDEKAFSYEKHFNLMKAVKQADGTYKEEMQELDGAWEKFSPADATFTMLLAEVKEGADATECPFPDGVPTSEKDGSTFMTQSVTRTSNSGGASGSFGSITFDRPGTYTYLITEDLSGTLVDGITYSRANYRVIVTVKDKEGKLEASVAKFQTFGEAGVELDTPLSLDAAKPVTFNNSAAYDSITLGPNAYKQLVDTTDGRALAAGEFTFGAVPITEGAPIPTDQNGNPLPTDTDVNGTQYYKSTNDTLGYIAFGTATFTQEHVKTGDSAAYVYKLFEVIPSDAVNASVDGGKKSYAEADEVQRAQAGWTKDGVTYDSSVYYARVTVKIDDNSTDNVNHVTAAISYHESPEPDAAVIIGNSVTFKNVYDPVDAVLAGDARIKGQKTLKGRDALEGEAFTFELTAFDDFTKQALKSDALVFGSDKTATELTAQAKGAKNGEPCGFAFDADMTFSKVGTYRFAIKEMVPGDPAANMTYDPTTAEAVVTITDAGGKLKAEVSYINPQAPSIVDQAVFTNVYHAEGALAEGIKVSKVLTGRAMKAGEFSATVVGIDNTAGNTTDDDANARLPKADTEISFPKASAGSPVSKKILGDILFTQEDAGKTFSYIVAEDVPAEGIDTAGVSYDRSQYRVDLAVTDTGTGKLSVTPTVTKIVDRDGKPLAGLGTVPAVSFENRYEPAQTVIEDTAGALPLTKKLSGRGWLDTDKFEFSLTAKSLNGKTDADSLTKIPMPKDARAVVTKDSAPHYDSTTGAVLDAAIKDFGFKGITYTQAGTYVYEVREVIPDDATNPDVPGKTYGLAGADERAKAGWTRGGVTYDSAMVATVTCEVKDNLTGQLYVEASCDPAAVPTFTNTYAAATPADASVEIQATKTFVNHQLDAREFEFGVAPFKNDGELGGEVLSGANGAAGSDQSAQVNFTGKLSYNTVDLAKAVKAGYANESIDGSGRATWTLKYLAYEKALDADKHPGVTQTASSFNFTVTVTDNGDGTLSAVANYPEGGLAFVNTYRAQGGDSATYTPTGAKVLQTASEGLAAPDIDKRYRFTLTGEKGAPMPAGDGSVTANDQTAVNFGAITFTLDMLDGVEQANDGSRSRTFTYTVKEEGFVPGVTNDADSKSFKLTLKDDGKGHLTVTPEGDPRLPLFTFVNTYTAQVPESDPVTTDGLFAKVLTGRDWMRGDAFTFVIEPVVDGTPMPDVTKVVLRRESAKAGEPQAFGFSKITFTYDDMKGSIPSADGTGAEKTFEYTVHEVVPEDAAKIPGITYSDNVAHLEITLRDDGKGNLMATRTLTDDEGTVVFDDKGNLKTPATFTNAYAAGAEFAGVPVVKELEGRDIKEGEFAFTVEGVGDASKAKLDGAMRSFENPAPGEGSPRRVEMTALAGMRFTQEDAGKTFAFEVAEKLGTAGGVTYDRSAFRVKLTVADNGDGTLEVTPEVERVRDARGDELPKPEPADQIAFKNSYEPGSSGSSVTDAIKVVKVLTGRELRAGEFSFELVEAGASGERVVASGTNAADGSVELTPVTYDAPGEHLYTLREVVPEEADRVAGVTYDRAVYTVRTAVTDRGDGTLSVAHELRGADGAAVEGPATFNNEYTPGAVEMDPAAAGFSFTKVLKGKAWDGDEFAFTLKGADGAPMPEADPDAGVTANGDGTLTKTVSAAMRKADGFDAADFGFGPIRFERAGVYAYAVREVVPEGDAANPGIAYDGHAAKVKVTVTDDGSGNLAATATVEEGTFTNSYATGAVDFDAAAGLQIVKNMTGKAIAKDAFSFTVEGMDDESAAKLNGGHKLTVGTAGAPLVGNTATETLSVATKLSFAQEDVGKTYRYTVFEADGGKIIDGVTYDGARHELAFAVTDGGSGVLEVAVSLDGEKVATYTGAASGARVADPVTVTFNNSYDAGSVDVGGDGAAAIKAHKTLTGRPLEADEFSFSVVNTLDDAAEPVTRGTNDAQGDIAFEPIAYTVEKLNGDVAAGLAAYADGVYTYTYAVSEDISSLPAGVTPVAASFTVKVLVTDSGTGSLDAQVVYPEGSDGSLEFRNAYGTGVGGSAELAVGGTKVLKVEGGETAPDIAGKYTFTLTGSKDAPMPEGAKDGVKTAVNDASGSVDLGTISYTMESVFGSGSGERTKTFDYTVTESGEVPGVVNDPVSSRSFTVTVTDNGNGTLSAVSSEKPGAQFAFTNTYAVEPTPSSPTSAGLTITKTLSGRDMLAGEFAFQLVDAAGKVVSTGTNDVEGKVELPAVTFTEPGDFAYTLREEMGDAAGVTYDNRAYSLRAHVADNGDGTLAVTWTYGSDDAKELKAEFKNEYAVAPRTITFNAAKVLTGRELREGEFSFQLYDGAGTLLQTVKNGAPVEGGYAPVVFDAVTIDRAGAYDFRIVEVAGDAEGIEYDKTEFTYHVVASDLDEKGNHTGKLEFEITEGETGAPVFRNTFSGTDGPGGGDTPGGTGTTPGTGSGGGSLVATGDDSMLAIMGVGAAGLVAVVAGIVVAKRRNRR